MSTLPREDTIIFTEPTNINLYSNQNIMKPLLTNDQKSNYSPQSETKLNDFQEPKPHCTPDKAKMSSIINRSSVSSRKNRISNQENQASTTQKDSHMLSNSVKACEDSTRVDNHNTSTYLNVPLHMSQDRKEWPSPAVTQIRSAFESKAQIINEQQAINFSPSIHTRLQLEASDLKM